MPALDPASIFAPRFNALGAPWGATGSIASIVYGEVRTTQDIDVVVLLDAAAAAAFERAFPEEEFYRPPREVIEAERSRERGGRFNLIHFDSGFKAGVYLSRADPLHLGALRNRRAVDIGGEQLWLVPPEYVILYKLEFFREGAATNTSATFAACLR